VQLNCRSLSPASNSSFTMYISFQSNPGPLPPAHVCMTFLGAPICSAGCRWIRHSIEMNRNKPTMSGSVNLARVLTPARQASAGTDSSSKVRGLSAFGPHMSAAAAASTKRTERSPWPWNQRHPPNGFISRQIIIISRPKA